MLVQRMRLQRGWSQQQLADLSGLSVRTIQRIERGDAPSTECRTRLGSGIVFHGLRVFDKLPFLNAQWEKAQVEKYLGRKL
jgi:transcriptional regulator with XRE-family HTH domain